MSVRINKKNFLAEQVIEVVRENIVPMQRVESGFDVQDHISHVPLQIKMQLILFDKTVTNPVWHITRVDGRIGAELEEELEESREDSYEFLKELYDSKELFRVDASDHARNPMGDPAGRNTSMIYENMAMTFIGQIVQLGNVYYCEVIFTQITKSMIATRMLYVQEMTIEDGAEVPHLLWSETPFEPTTTEGAMVVNESENPPGCRAISPDGQKVTSKNALDDIMNWVSGIKEGIDGSLVFLIEP